MSTSENNNLETLGNEASVRRWQDRSGALTTYAWYLFVVGCLIWGWSLRDSGFTTPQNGLGYWLGIIGGSMMLIMLTYSLRKRIRALRRFLTVKFWFQLHMALGILGPLLILFHSNFHLGSLNSTIALACMLLVASSGIVGRYLYTKIHYGLYGEKIKLQQLHSDFDALAEEIADFLVTDKQQQVSSKLFAAIHELISEQQESSGLWSRRANRRKVVKISAALKKLVEHLDAHHAQSKGAAYQPLQVNQRFQDHSGSLLTVLDKLPGLQISERLFSLWHVIHLPLFGLMIITAITHVVVVHMY